MGRHEDLLERVLLGRSVSGIRFESLCRLLRALGFDERIRGSHHIFTMDGVEEILNLQPRRGEAKPYQVKQVRAAALKYRLRLGE